MVTALEKARRDPESTKARILQGARRVFGDYGYHGATTRMIAQEAGIDISTLHYHWGEKRDLYETVVLDITKDLRQQLSDVEKEIRGLPLKDRLAISIDRMTDYLFAHPEIANLLLLRYVSKTRYEGSLDFKVTEITSDIARSMGLCKDRKGLSPGAAMEVWAVMNSILTFISGEEFFRSLIQVDKEAYAALVKETLRFIHIPAFNQTEEKDH
ncbi:MAG: TetR/AcrR family transcriptional regulator [Desulfuromonadales bacterium]|nr:TetR/AcrR family transcriptional regulator [Desulfuromonadales bacterium]